MSLEAFLYEVAFLVALVAPLAAAGLLAFAMRRRARTRRRVAVCVAVLLATLAAHPIAQFPVLEPFDEHRGHVLAAKANAAQLVGMTGEQARALLGTPNSVHHFASGTTLWAYKQLPGYWFGSSFQVFVRDKAVTGFEANDD